MIPLLIALCLLWAAPAWAACSGASPNWTADTWADVATCHTNASNGDTITVSPGSTTASSTGTAITKYVKLIGTGVTLTDATPSPLSNSMLTITESTAGSTRVEGFTIIQSAIHDNPTGVIKITSAAGGKPVLITGNSYTTGSTGDFIIANTNKGVIWNNTMTSVPAGSNCLANSAFVRHKPQSGTSSWHSPPTYGSADTDGTHALYIEGNNLTDVVEGVDVDDDGRAVIRFNTLKASATAAHGIDTSSRGGRYFEDYGNTFQVDNATQPNCTNTGHGPINLNGWATWRGGSGLLIGNVLPNQDNGTWGVKSEVTLFIENLRRNAGAYPCYANQGTDLYPGPYSAGWGYSAGGTTVGGGAHDCNNSTCSGGAVNQDIEPVYILANSSGANYTSPSRSNYIGTNQCGASAGTASTYLQLNREVYAQTSATANSGPSSAPTPFDGTTGTGFGPIASRPDACTQGVAYWATNEGNWNTTVAANTSGKMYLCTATNTWTAKYGTNSSGEVNPGEPYVYPHPLAGVIPSVPGLGRMRMRF